MAREVSENLSKINMWTNAGYDVKVMEWLVGGSEENPCRWFGHFSYKCGKCKLGYIKVYSLFDYDTLCPNCSGRVYVKKHVKT
jgi:DNA-directed RNA polymerase subunit RPC12/RpoP